MAGEDSVGLYRATYGRFLAQPLPHDTAPEPTGARVEVGGNPPIEAVKAQLAAAFADHPGTARIALTASGQLVGHVTPESLAAADGTSGGGIGDGDGLTFPLETAAYRAIVFKCAKTGCAERGLSAYFDPRDVPVCPVHKVPMALERK